MLQHGHAERGQIAAIDGTDHALAVQALRRQGVDVIVALVHNGGHTDEPFDRQDCRGLQGEIVEVARRLDPQIENAALSLGASRLTIWRRVILPQIVPGILSGSIIVFALAVVIGFYVIGKVAHSLHTPLMSITNAISGIIIVGGMTQLASDYWAVKIIAFVAVLLASINVFGGFTVTARMLNMFKKG